MFGLLQWAVSGPGTQAYAISLLLKHGANPHRDLTPEEMQQHYPQTPPADGAQHPLYLTCAQGKADVVRVLLAHGLHGRAHNTPAPTHNTSTLEAGEDTQAVTEAGTLVHSSPAPTFDTAPTTGAGEDITQAATGTGGLAHNNDTNTDANAVGGQSTQAHTEGDMTAPTLAALPHNNSSGAHVAGQQSSQSYTETEMPAPSHTTLPHNYVPHEHSPPPRRLCLRTPRVGKST